MKDKQIVKLNHKPLHQIGRGHTPHRNAGVMLDPRTKRCRTRGAAFRDALRDE